MQKIHPTALVDPGAQIDETVVVGPYTVIGPHVQVDAGTTIGAHCVIEGRTRIGRDNRIFQFNSLGAIPQDKKYAGEPCELVIGDRNTVREFCTFNIGSPGGAAVTSVGDDNWIMAYVHLAHDCKVGSNTIFANNSQLAGHVQVGDWAILGGFTVVHQFVRLGAHSLTAMCSLLFADLPPFVMCQGQPAAARSMNYEGLRRRGFSPERVAAVKAMHKFLYRDNLGLEQARAQITGLAATYPDATEELRSMSGLSRPGFTATRHCPLTSHERSAPNDAVIRAANWPHIAMVAGETSGDLLAGLLLDGMQSRWPGLQAAGIGGAQMQKRAFDVWWRSDKLAVRGYVEVLRHYREITSIRDQLRKRLLRDRPDLFIGVDAPDFNLDLERNLKQTGIKTVQFVCPSVWAWRADRMDRIRESAAHVLCLFPFEPELLHRHGIDATYVGHPLAGIIPMRTDKSAARQALGLAPDREVVAILPGSRASEIQYLARRFFDAAIILKRMRPAIRFVVPAIPSLEPMIRRIAGEYGAGHGIQIVSGQSHLALAACDVTLIASGTATLEAALFKRPMVIAYNMHWLSWQIMRRKRLQPWVGLPNILCREFVVPEFLQDQASPAALSAAVAQWLDAPERIAALQVRFARLHTELLRDTPRLATDAIEKLLSN